MILQRTMRSLSLRSHCNTTRLQLSSCSGRSSGALAGSSFVLHGDERCPARAKGMMRNAPSDGVCRYPAGILEDLDPKKPHAVVILGMRLVLWCNDAGDWQAFEDKCSHRAVALSEGRLENGHLQCAYHGWTFDGAPLANLGQCRGGTPLAVLHAAVLLASCFCGRSAFAAAVLLAPLGRRCRPPPVAHTLCREGCLCWHPTGGNKKAGREGVSPHPVICRLLPGW